MPNPHAFAGDPLFYFAWWFQKKSVNLQPINNIVKIGDTTMAIDIKVIPTLHGDEAERFVSNAEAVMRNNNRIDFSAKVAEARAILRKAGM